MREMVIVAAIAVAACDRDPTPEELARFEARAAERRAEREKAKAALDAERKAAEEEARALAQVKAEAAAWRTKKRTRAELLDERRRWALRLSASIDAPVRATGKDRTTYRVTSPLCDELAVEAIAVERDMFDAVQVLGVRRLECSNGSTTWTKTWK